MKVQVVAAPGSACTKASEGWLAARFASTWTVDPVVPDSPLPARGDAASVSSGTASPTIGASTQGDPPPPIPVERISSKERWTQVLLAILGTALAVWALSVVETHQLAPSRERTAIVATRFLCLSVAHVTFVLGLAERLKEQPTFADHAIVGLYYALTAVPFGSCIFAFALSIVLLSLVTFARARAE